FTIRIGGADMPVVICFLNALSGLAASLCGFVTQNPLLVACGAMVGASGILLSQKMCRAMNRNLANVFLGLGVTPVSGKRLEPDSLQLEKKAEMTEEDKFSFSLKILKEADEVIITPGSAFRHFLLYQGCLILPQLQNLPRVVIFATTQGNYIFKHPFIILCQINP
ncbi:unnamed protein product, partial [marine sediment metagenome]